MLRNVTNTPTNKPNDSMANSTPKKKSKNRKPRTNRAAYVAKSNSTTTSKPKILTTPKKTTIRHREYISDMNPSLADAFGQYAFPINPAQTGTFPWLSAIAANYESYRFNMLKFVYSPSCSTTSPGSFMMAVDYDANDQPPGNKVQLMSMAGAVRSAVWDSCVYTCAIQDLHKFGTQRYTRPSDIPAQTDLKTYDVGNLFASWIGSEKKIIGELYVEYEVDLFTPQLPPMKVAAKSEESQQLFWNTQSATAQGTYISSLLAQLSTSGAGEFMDVILNPNYAAYNIMMHAYDSRDEPITIDWYKAIRKQTGVTMNAPASAPITNNDRYSLWQRFRVLFAKSNTKYVSAGPNFVLGLSGWHNLRFDNSYLRSVTNLARIYFNIIPININSFLQLFRHDMNLVTDLGPTVTEFYTRYNSASWQSQNSFTRSDEGIMQTYKRFTEVDEEYEVVS